MFPDGDYFYPVLVGYCLAYYLAAGLAINVTYHRCLSHRSFDLWRPLKYLFVTIGIPAGTPVQWVGNHRFHHRHADRPGDPHSPVLDGFWYAHVGWYIGTKNVFVCVLYSLAGPLRTLYDGWNRPRTNLQHNDLAADIESDRYFRFISRPVPFMVLCWAHTAIFFVLAYFIWGWVGIAFLWLTLVVIYNLGDSIDSVAHLRGERPFDAVHYARNNLWLGLLTLGEGWHANHLVFPWSARHGLHERQFDASWQMIRVMGRLGFVNDIRLPTRESITAAMSEAESMTEQIEPMNFVDRLESVKRDQDDPDPWLAMYLDRSIRMDDEAKAALLISMSSGSRGFFLPLIRPFIWAFAHLVTLFRIFFPRSLTSSKVLHRSIYFGLKNFVAPEANFIILRHFHIGSEILAFIAANAPETSVKLNPLRPEKLEDVLEDIFLKHDLNLFNFVINLNTELREKGIDIQTPDRLNFDAVTDGPFPIKPFPKRWTNFIDVQSAIEIYTPLYQLFLSDRDFWRASNSLQLDETVALYVSRILGDAQYIGLVNNKHPLIPLPTISAGFRLLLHGLAAETLHALLREKKRLATV